MRATTGHSNGQSTGTVPADGSSQPPRVRAIGRVLAPAVEQFKDQPLTRDQAARGMERDDIDRVEPRVRDLVPDVEVLPFGVDAGCRMTVGVRDEQQPLDPLVRVEAGSTRAHLGESHGHTASGGASMVIAQVEAARGCPVGSPPGHPAGPYGCSAWVAPQRLIPGTDEDRVDGSAYACGSGKHDDRVPKLAHAHPLDQLGSPVNAAFGTALRSLKAMISSEKEKGGSPAR